MTVPEIIQQHKDGIEEMAKDIKKASESLGEDHSLVQKMKTIYETVESFSIAEMVLFNKFTEQDDE